MSRSGVTSRSALPHSGTSRLGGHSRLRKPTSTSIRAISNFGTSKSRTCARLGCLRIERWAREGIARANVAFPPIATSTVAIANGSFTSTQAVRSAQLADIANSDPSARADEQAKQPIKPLPRALDMSGPVKSAFWSWRACASRALSQPPGSARVGWLDKRTLRMKSGPSP